MAQSFPTEYAHNLGASTNPGATNDANQGYTVGSIWVNTTAGTAWMCVDSTIGAAVWKQISN